ncbi:MAG TPA: hypothetical protein VMV14_04140 [Acidimicrobiales bacterium]|nr:hypothetical protein [Acidimicrobiales bacterium]
MSKRPVVVAMMTVAVVMSMVLVPRSGAGAGSPTPSTYCVGAAKADITPTADMIATGHFYLGGYGIGPVHPAGSVLRDIYSRAIAFAVPNADGTCPTGGPNQVVIAADDLQGHFIAYQQGSYGFADVAAAVQSATAIPASQILAQSTHTHNGPDDLGIWGGVPTDYLAEVASGTEHAILSAVAAEVPAHVSWATRDMTGFSGTFGPSDTSDNIGDTTDYPMDEQLRMLQARSLSTGAVVATLLNYSTHATVYGPLDKVSPDWPGAAATYLEGDQVGDAGTGFPGSVAVVTVGAMGHTWPAAIPSGKAAPDAPAGSDANAPADSYGDAVAHQGIEALAAGATVLAGPAQVGGKSSSLTVVNDNPLLLATLLVPTQTGYHVYRKETPPYGAVDALITEAQFLRLGDLALMSAPGEPYPAIEATMSKEVGAPVVFPFGLANDQLGYVEQLDDYNGAMQCSTTDEGFFTISPTFGNDFEMAQRKNAAALGFTVTDPGPVADANLGSVPPPTVCSVQQLQSTVQNPAGQVP